MTQERDWQMSAPTLPPVKGHRWFAATHDALTQWSEARILRPLRQQIVADASGVVLEIGAGTGANFPYYRVAQRIVATEPDPYMLPRARRRARELALALDV